MPFLAILRSCDQLTIPRSQRPPWKLLIFSVIFVLLVISSSHWLPFFYPLPHKELVMTCADEYGVDPYLVFSIIRVESRFKHNARSRAGATGLMQIMPETGEWIAHKMKLEGYDPELLTDPEYNIRMGTWYLADLSREFDGRLPLVIAAYNAGRGNVRQWLLSETWDGTTEGLKNVPFPETRSYVRNVLKTYRIYQAVYRQHL